MCYWITCKSIISYRKLFMCALGEFDVSIFNFIKCCTLNVCLKIIMKTILALNCLPKKLVGLWYDWEFYHITRLQSQGQLYPRIIHIKQRRIFQNLFKVASICRMCFALTSNILDITKIVIQTIQGDDLDILGRGSLDDVSYQI